MSTDLNIHIISNLKSTSFFILYQQNINLTTKNFKAGVWKKGYIASGAEFFTALPLNFEIQAKVKGTKEIYKTKLIAASYNHSYEIYMNNSGIDLHESNLIKPSNNTVNIYNTINSMVSVIALKNSNPIFSAYIRPSSELNFAIIPSLYISICDSDIDKDFFNPSSLSPMTKIDYMGQSYVNIFLNENTSTGKFQICYDFNLPQKRIF
ncbi:MULTISPECIES: hypothetical protein [Clostridium]|uniref:hypothetical protein n=1 Tax=Clostridium TaxID=1485 RepID=UPI000824598C|nr:MULTISPECIES: hypothetical protein [Clostridium]PJI10551.1 hypothetical protein CUB90_00720 [Clostridium sp. CT7]